MKYNASILPSTRFLYIYLVMIMTCWHFAVELFRLPMVPLRVMTQWEGVELVPSTPSKSHHTNLHSNIKIYLHACGWDETATHKISHIKKDGSSSFFFITSLKSHLSFSTCEHFLGQLNSKSNLRGIHTIKIKIQRSYC